MTVYTDNEKKLLKIVKSKKGKPLTTLEIVELHYKNRFRPKFARQSVVCVLNKLVKQTKKTKKTEGFALCKTERNGPHPNQYWVE